MSASPPRIVVVGCGFPQLGLLRFCRDEGLHVVGVDANPRAVGVGCCDGFIEASTRDTEAIVNHLFARVTGWEWDVMAGTRVLSARAAADIVSHCEDDGISTDVSWPLHLRAAGGYTLGYREVEGLEYETADRYSAEVAAAGGQAAWLEELDADLRRWAYRLEMARLHVQAMASGAASGAPS